MFEQIVAAFLARLIRVALRLPQKLVISYVQVSVLTICTFSLSEQVGNVAPTTHPQSLRYPRQAHRRFCPQPSGQLDFMLIPFASPRQFLPVPSQPLEFLRHEPLGPLLAAGERSPP